MTDGLTASLEASIREIPVVDCHEHTFLPDRRPARVDLGTLVAGSDLADDLISAGMPAEARARLGYADAAPFLGHVRNTGFSRSLMAAFAELFDFREETISATDWEALSELLATANTRPGWYDDVLGRGRVTTILRIQGDEPDPLAVPRRWFRPILRIDPWIVEAGSTTERERIAERAGGRGTTLADYLEALDGWFSAAAAGGAVGIKSMLAYRRPLTHGRPTAEEAERLFQAKHRSAAEERALEDAIVHAVAERAGRAGLPWQIHVGIGSWQTNIVGNGDPVMLDPLVSAHRGTTFVLLHGGYPYLGQIGSMAKNHPNVVIECGWLAYIAPAAYRRALAEWLDSVPVSKILAVGADCAHVEQTLGALLLTRHDLARVLAEKIRHDGWSEKEAISSAHALLGRNAGSVYRLDGAGGGGGTRA